MKATIRALFFIAGLLSLSACSLLPEEVDETKGWSAQKFYEEASFAMSEGDYDTAIKYYEGLEARYPFGRFAMQAQLDVAYAYYKDAQPESSIAAAERFIKLHPRNPYVAYAYYLKGLVNFNRNISFITRFVPTDQSQRDPGSTLDSFNDFAELVRRFPDSEYAEDARKRMTYLRNNLAMHEVHVARYYLDRGAYLASANRCVTVIEKYQRTPAIREALVTMIEAYDALGMQQLAGDARRVLALNEGAGNFALPELDQEAGEKTLIRRAWEYMELDEN
ncbi:MAG: outer membrane protein assembly factor BamD [Candidatus Sedimenticola endophacoides]|uniref:Outer membrane protein assembly factor BamD n=1 Tax=Candidatus Sedimenticola endophacoides TaxID=2548426 RepID=A0A657Q4D3_9GAMM|nr:MAG: outer membrane protein assembly factor BamD [Candidatus Sedimenticola endophacoides]OQX34488.1 MAG: outer membrane protein assembly factor BamD [Candidatus Sedimenticola endophacoides]OQX39860.1 MAG: outer membrane protein assembly factor BamD [Candidatus Sedimenticola endophacoides]OQX45236.1 MAG: outer membrane protein assembly factor BamD [Candidatus Sedimenticola endophacoides]OQX47997.1 MAG: outer membrane protein assembly factor BamD [Candidatus Sedimenticola endophacoides]